ncbi:MAG TPA: ABC transporter permease [Euzebyales bacterium]|nr:ABC transporter permease [Euzebyales bacterium]
MSDADTRPQADQAEGDLRPDQAVGQDSSAAVAAATGGADVGGVGREASLWSDAWRQLRRNPLFILAALIIVTFTVMAAFPHLFTSFYPGDPDPRSCSLSNSTVRPSATAWFGYDLQGCDYYANVIYGAKVSMIVGIATAIFAGAIAIIFGSLAGYYGGRLDTLISRITDIFFGIPTILGAIVILNSIGERGLTQVTIVLVALGWMTMLRLMRSSTIERRDADFVDAARALGASTPRVIMRHILPNAIAPVIVYGTIFIGVAISVEASLSFLGAGLQLPAISWGLMINSSFRRVLQAPHLLLFPGTFLTVLVLAFIVLGDALRDALDPRLR